MHLWKIKLKNNVLCIPKSKKYIYNDEIKLKDTFFLKLVAVCNNLNLFLKMFFLNAVTISQTFK